MIAIVKWVIENWSWYRALILGIFSAITFIMIGIGNLCWKAFELLGELANQTWPELETDFAAAGVNMEILNAFFPFKEGWALFVHGLVIWTIIHSFRWVKSLIPLLGN